MLRLIVLWLAACESAPPPIPPAPPATTAPVAAPSTGDRTDEHFRSDIRRFAAARGRTIAAWGTLHLDGTARRTRYAMLDVLPLDDKGDRPPGSAHDGAYVLEEAPDRYWIVTRWWNSFGFRRADPQPVGEPAWETLEDRWIEHVQMHNHGKARVAFGLRGGELVVLRAYDYNSRFENDTVDENYATDGVCKARCPPLRGAKLRGVSLPVSGPARNIADLVEPPPQF